VTHRSTTTVNVSRNGQNGVSGLVRRYGAVVGAAIARARPLLCRAQTDRSPPIRAPPVRAQQRPPSRFVSMGVRRPGDLVRSSSWALPLRSSAAVSCTDRLITTDPAPPSSDLLQAVSSLWAPVAANAFRSHHRHSASHHARATVTTLRRTTPIAARSRCAQGSTSRGGVRNGRAGRGEVGRLCTRARGTCSGEVKSCSG